MSYQKIRPVDGDRITANPDGSLNVPDQPIIPFIEGDGIGPDITKASMHIWNTAIEQPALSGQIKAACIVYAW